VLNTAQAADHAGYTGDYSVGSTIAVQRGQEGAAFVGVQRVAPSEVLVLANHAG